MTFTIFSISTEKMRQIHIYVEAFTEIFRFSVHEFSQVFGKYSMKHKRYNHSKCICLCSACLIEGLCV